MDAKLIGLAAFIATGGGLMIYTSIREKSFFGTEILLIIGFFFMVGLIDHFKNLMVGDKNGEDR